MTEREQELQSALEDMVYQFAYRGEKKKRLVIHTGGLSALEGAFSVLGWPDPKPDPSGECEENRCHKEATCGTPTKRGKYMRLCGVHYRKLQA